MATITIKNVGPIKEIINLEFNKVNVFMGPQSSGKSTIAKIISYCTWVEKDVATSQSLKTYQENKTYFKEHLESFHKIRGYFRADSYILYKSEVVEIKWENEKSSLNWVDQYAYKRSKIAYIPSERNMVILPDARKVEFGHSNIRSFLFEWFDARKKYTKEDSLPLLELGVNYYFADSNIYEEDRIFGENDGIEYDIALPNASSGLQSITPLIAMIDYLTYWIYAEDKKSFEQEERQRKVGNHIFDEMVLKPFFKINSIPTYEKNEKIREFHEIIKESNLEAKKLLSNCIKLQKNLFITQNSQFIIEEPEQNLFPETQRDLTYHFLEKCLIKEGNRLTITTHSPYILYALNNCMMGYLIKDNMPEEEQEELLSKKAWINPEFVSVWEIEQGKGTIRPIKNSETGTISKHYFNRIMNDVMEEYHEMLTRLKVNKHEK